MIVKKLLATHLVFMDSEYDLTSANAMKGGQDEYVMFLSATVGLVVGEVNVNIKIFVNVIQDGIVLTILHHVIHYCHQKFIHNVCVPPFVQLYQMKEF